MMFDLRLRLFDQTFRYIISASFTDEEYKHSFNTTRLNSGLSLRTAGISRSSQAHFFSSHRSGVSNESERSCVCCQLRCFTDTRYTSLQRWRVTLTERQILSPQLHVEVWSSEWNTSQLIPPRHEFTFLKKTFVEET